MSEVERTAPQKLSVADTQKLCNEVKAMRHYHIQWRVGQLWFNALHGINPELADSIRSTENDPFYSNDKMWPFFCAVIENPSEVLGELMTTLSISYYVNE